MNENCQKNAGIKNEGMEVDATCSWGFPYSSGHSSPVKLTRINVVGVRVCRNKAATPKAKKQ